MDRRDHVTRRQFQDEVPQDDRHNDRCLLQGQAGPDTDTRADAERKISKTIDGLARLAEEAAGIEAVGIGP
jgi:hypothetical protein